MPNNAPVLPTPILITGAGGFVGRNLVATLHAMGCRDLLLFEKDDTPETLADFCRRAAFVVHLAGINRPTDPRDFYSGNSRADRHDAGRPGSRRQRLPGAGDVQRAGRAG